MRFTSLSVVIALSASSALGCALQSAPSPRAAVDHVTASAPSPAQKLASGRAPALSDDPAVDSVSVPGSSVERARATVGVSAPVDRVRAVIFDFAHYPEFMPHYDSATVLKKTASGGQLVEMAITELGGLIHLRLKSEIAAPKQDGSTETYDGHLVEGNVRAFQWRWQLEAVSPGRTRLTVESFLDPDMALVPTSFLNQGARAGVRDAILAIKARAEGGSAAR